MEAYQNNGGILLTNAMKKRDPGIDLLRVISMGLIVLHHLLLHGGMTSSFSLFSPSGLLINLFNAATRCAVNVYALISGYVMVKARFRPSRLIGLWIQVVFYGVLAALWLPLMGGNWHLQHFVDAVTPVSHDQYWYFTCYFAVFCLSPFLNLLLHAMSKRQSGTLLMTFFVLLSLLPALMLEGRFQLSGGYHPAWLLVMYLFGGVMRIHGVPGFGGRLKACAAIAGCVLLSWGFRLAALTMNAPELEEHLLQYAAPTTLICSIAVFLLFVCQKLPGWLSKAAFALSPLTFGVYLIHDNPLIREHLIKMQLTGLAGMNAGRMLGGLFACWAGVYGLCLLVEWLRTKLFAALKVSALCEKIEKKLFIWANRVFPEADA